MRPLLKRARGIASHPYQKEKAMLIPMFLFTLVSLLLGGVVTNLYLYTHRALRGPSPRRVPTATPTSALHEVIFQ